MRLLVHFGFRKYMCGLFVHNISLINPLSANPHKMVKHTETVHCLLFTNCLSVFDHFVGLALKGLNCKVNGSILLIQHDTFQM